MEKKRGKDIMEEVRPLISVIVPVYNVELYLEKCVRSILQQTYENLEILLIPNGAITDRSEIICDRFASEDDRVSVIRCEQGGVANARNAGIQRAAGDYIGFVDADDWIEKTMYEDLYQTLIEDHADISVCAYFCDDERTQKSKALRAWDREKLNTYEALGWLASNKITSFCWNKLFRKSLFSNVVFPDVRIFEDVAVMHKLFAKAEMITMVEKPEYHYVRHKGSLITSRLLEDRLTALSVLRERHIYLVGIDSALGNHIVPAVYSAYVTTAASSVKAKREERHFGRGKRKSITNYFKRYTAVFDRNLTVIQRFCRRLLWADHLLSDYVALLTEAARRVFKKVIQTRKA